jgi:hypothetical protein
VANIIDVARTVSTASVGAGGINNSDHNDHGGDQHHYGQHFYNLNINWYAEMIDDSETSKIEED